MIARYSMPEMTQLWSDEEKYNVWLRIEILACEAWAEKGKIPAEALENIRTKAKIDVARIDEIEAECRHDVIAFTTCLAESIGPDSRFVHMGLTSMDVVDTAQCARTVKAFDLILEKLDKLLEILKRQTLEHKDTIMIGRTHGVHAEPITMGLKFMIWLDEFERHKQRLEAARETMSVGKISGAVGTYAHTGLDVEKYVLEKMGLKPTYLSSQIVQRDRHAEALCAIAQCGASIEKVATEIRNLQRTEISELEESFAKGQKGSSAMPHKRNPIACENVTGLARLLRGYAVAGLETVSLWHERDLSNSSCEGITLVDGTTLLHYIINRISIVLDDLWVKADRMKENIDASMGCIYSQRVLLALIDKGMTREDAYKVAQDNAMAAWHERVPLREKLLADPRATEFLSEDDLDKAMDSKAFLRYVDDIYDRRFGSGR